MIYFDVSTLNPDKVTGVGVYMHQLLAQFHKMNVQVTPVLKISRWKKKAALEQILPQQNCKFLLPWSFYSGKDVYHGPDFKISTGGAFPKVVTVHDMVVFEQKYNAPEFYQKGIAALTKVLQARDLSAVIANSEFTKKEILKYFPQLDGKIHVTYLGCERKESTGSSSLALPTKYILYLGTLEKRKNVVGVIKAFEKFKAMGFEHKLVLAGKPGFGSEEIETEIQSSVFKNDILKINYVSDADLPKLYANADLFLFPSFYEGFGIPALEAMAQGCPVVISSGGALDEVCGDAALKAPAYDYDGLAAHLKQIVTDSNLKENLKLKGFERANKFTWEKCAQETLKIYRNAVVLPAQVVPPR